MELEDKTPALFLSMVKYEFDQSDARQKPGIYGILIGNRTYIGSTKRNIWVRIKEHERLLKWEKHYNKNMQRAYNKFNDIVFFVIEYCNPDDVCKREQYFIDKWDPHMNIVRKVANYN